jgi:hypothetical protein
MLSMISEPTEEMLRAGQEALFEVCPDYTIEEREDLARKVWAAMELAAGYFGCTPKTAPDYAESEAALKASIVDRLRNGPAPPNDPDLNDQAADYIERWSDPLMERINRSGPFKDAP